jgi:glycosyltransferase involved in cell wall biosynthesis
MTNVQGRKEFLIIFTDIHFSYSPTTLNLFYELKAHYHVELITPRPSKSYSLHQVEDTFIKYLDFNQNLNVYEWMIKISKRIKDKFNKPSEEKLVERSLYTNKTRAIISYIKKQKGKEIIAVDFMALWCAQKAGKKAHLLSLEILENNYYKNVDLTNILSLIIQSEERLNYLFPLVKPKYFLVQNAPKYIEFDPPYDSRRKIDLIYCGSAMLGFGIISCLDFIKDYEKYTLTLIGALPEETKTVIDQFYRDLIDESRLFINNTYLSASELTRFISKYRIGFAFYDFYRFSNLRTFNYLSAPSGKVFQYLNSGVPVVANNIPGFNFLVQNHCGELIDYLSSNQIKKALDKIESEYKFYSKNAKSYSKKNDFVTQIKPFINYLTN